MLGGERGEEENKRGEGKTKCVRSDDLDGFRLQGNVG